MNRRFAQLIVVMALSGTFLGTGYEALAQEVNQEGCRETRKEEKRMKAMQRNNRWASKYESKMIREFASERKFDTPATARGSEAGFTHNGEYFSLGYFDKNNSFRSYTRQAESRVRLRGSIADPSVVGLWEQAEARSKCTNVADLE